MTSVTSPDRVEIHLVAHTHWDREWYRPASQFRQRLVALIDELLDTPGATPFLLDGQAVLLDDYLEVRPERASDLSAGLRSGALEAGPWYVLPDELIPSGEALVRNLLAGRRVLRGLRASPPPVLYCPDSFGHPATLSTVAAGFGFPVVMVWRGYGGPRWPDGDTVRWRGPDGVTCLLYHLPSAGYEVGSHLPVHAGAGARQHWVRLRDALVPRSSLGVVLLPHGADHHAPQPHQAEAIAALAEAVDREVLVRSSLATFAERLMERAARRVLPVIEGELRDSYGYTWTLAGTLGARAHLKRRNALAERLLTRDAEPWAALARLRDGRGRRHLLAAAWRSLLLCHPHDTLCGCSIDEVARAVDARLDEAVAAAVGVRDDAVDALLGHDAAAARSRADEWAPAVVVRNRSARRRTGVAEIEIDEVLAEVPVGPGSAGAAMAVRASASVSLGAEAMVVQVLDSERVFDREESPRHYPRNRLIERRRALVWVNTVPAFGLRVLPVGKGSRRRPRAPETARATPTGMENSHVRVIFDGATLGLATIDGLEVPDFLGFEAQGEGGDLYTHSPIVGTRVDARLVRGRVSARGPLRSELSTQWEIAIPPRAVSEATGIERVVPRSNFRIRALVQLDAGAPFVRILIASESRASDVRIRARVRTGTSAPRVYADAAFGPVERRALRVPDEEAAVERPPGTAPLHRYVTLANDRRGGTVYSDGLAEYEATPDGDVLITLARAVGELSRADLPERLGHAAWPVTTPEAQLTEPLRAMLALLPHGPRRPALVPCIESVADDVLLPLVGTTWRTAIAPPPFVEGAQLVGRGLACTAIKESEDGEWVVLRAANLLEESVSGSWRVQGVREAWLARLDEQPLGARMVQNGVIEFEAPPRAVMTFLVR